MQVQEIKVVLNSNAEIDGEVEALSIGNVLRNISNESNISIEIPINSNPIGVCKPK